MVVPLVNFSQRNALNSFSVSWMDIVGVALHFSILPIIAGFLLMTVWRENLSERVSHLHFTIKCPGHVTVWRESALILLEFSYWGLGIMGSVIGWESLPLFLNSGNKQRLLNGPIPLVPLIWRGPNMHIVIVEIICITKVVNLLTERIVV